MTWRGLAWFWGLILAGSTGLAVVLQVLGPPVPDAPPPARNAPLAAAPAEPSPPPAAETAPVAHAALPITPPLMALLEASPNFPGTYLPRVATDGSLPRSVYARPYAPGVSRPRIALLIDGLDSGMVDALSALAELPGPISVAVSPYVLHPDELLQSARQHGHEYFLSIPMEPDGYPVNEEGFRSLLLAADPATNRLNLEWDLTRFSGYVGATGAMDGLRGQRFAAGPQFTDVLDQLQMRGLMYLDPRSGQAPSARVASAVVDLAIDDSPVRGDLDNQLLKLEQLARNQGSAIAMAGPLHAVTIGWVADWARGLDARGIELVPVSALAKAPAGQTPGNQVKDGK